VRAFRETNYADRLVVRARSLVFLRRRLAAFARGRFVPSAVTRSIGSFAIARAAPKVTFRTSRLMRPRSPPSSLAAAIEPRTAATAADPASAPTSRAPEIAARAVFFTRFTAPTEIASPVSIASCTVRATVPTGGGACWRPIERLLASCGPCLRAVMSFLPPRFGSIHLPPPAPASTSCPSRGTSSSRW